jgi:hypothetical protein
MFPPRLLLAAALLLAPLAAPQSARAAFRKAEHPFILWTPEEAAAIRKRIETEPWAKERLKSLPNNTFGNLFKYQILGDQKAGDAEREYLLSFIDAPLDGKGDTGGSAGLHTANYLSALRYDVLYDTLTPEQRAKIEATFRRHVQEELPSSKPVGRFGILPNLALPRRCGVLLMTVALQDEALIRQLADQPRSLKWFLETYLADGRFYGEEFGKMTSIIGEFLIYARGLDRIGMGAYGFDFKGENGGTLRGYIGSLIELGYPRTELAGRLPLYPRISMGDARGGALFRHANVPERAADGSGGWQEFYAANMNGRDHTGRKIEKLQTPQWFEILAARYPDPASAERYLLAQMRRPDQDRYYPTLFWGLDPIDPKTVQPPPAPSWVAPERGFAFLRAEESPAYWTSPAPAVALQFAQMYVHNTSDVFSLLGYHAFNRPIYVNRAISAGYNGGPWDFHVRGHAGVVVDTQQAQPIGIIASRHAFHPAVKFVSARGVAVKPLTGKEEARPTDQPREPVTEVYSDIDLSRSLFLTREYLLDIYDVRDKRGADRDFTWLVHAPGSATGQDTADWTATDELQELLFRTPWQNPVPADQRTREQRLYDAPVSGSEGPDWVTIQNTRKFAAANKPFALSLLQDYHGADPAAAALGAEWYGRKVGVRVSMLGAPGTTVYTFDTPTRYTAGAPRSADSKDSRVLEPEHGGVSLAVRRRGPATTFVALHEPFENGRPAPVALREIAQTPEAIAVAVTGPAVNDRALLQFDRRPEDAVRQHPELETAPGPTPVTLAGDDESFTFTGHAFVRVTPERVEASGLLQAARIRVQGTPKFFLKGKETPAKISAGFLTF